MARPRKSESELVSSRIDTRWNPRETLIITQVAAAYNCGKAEVIRNCFRYIISGYPAFFGDELKELRSLRSEIRKTGNNLNQIAKALNAEGRVESALILAELEEQKLHNKTIMEYLNERVVKSQRHNLLWQKGRHNRGQ